MRYIRSLALLACLAAPAAADEAAKPVVEVLSKEPLLASPGIYVMMSRITMPPHAEIPIHRHPGKETFYVISGSVERYQEDKGWSTLHAGDVAHMPMGIAHSGRTGDEGCTVIAVHVLKDGEPVRIPVE